MKILFNIDYQPGLSKRLKQFTTYNYYWTLYGTMQSIMNFTIELQWAEP